MKNQTADLQNVTITVAVNYHLDRAKVSDIYQNIGDDYQNRIIDPAIQETVKDTVDTSLASRVRPYGVIVDAVSIVNFNFSA